MFVNQSDPQDTQGFVIAEGTILFEVDSFCVVEGIVSLLALMHFMSNILSQLSVPPGVLLLFILLLHPAPGVLLVFLLLLLLLLPFIHPPSGVNLFFPLNFIIFQLPPFSPSCSSLFQAPSPFSRLWYGAFILSSCSLWGIIGGIAYREMVVYLLAVIKRPDW